MASNTMFSEVATLAGEPARASMLHALLDGRALTATMLARVAGVAPQTGSGHLNRLAGAGLLSAEKRGRHRYYRLASPSVARMLEGIMQVAAELESIHAPRVSDPKHAALRRARTCYDHLAGELGVTLTEALVLQGHVELTGEAGLLTDSGVSFLSAIGLDVEKLLARSALRSGRVLCRACFDWSERRAHLGGAVGAAIHGYSLRQGWIRQLEGTRALLITSEGQRVFRGKFGATIK